MGQIVTISKVIFAAAILAGCVSEDKMYGQYWIGPNSRAPDMDVTLDVVLPNRAPSISNSFYSYTGRSDDPPNEHFGVDVIGERGLAVIAAIDGEVIKVFTDPFYGNNIVIFNGLDASGQRILTHFKHLDSQLVTVGQTVIRGEQIGTLGNSGLLSGGIVHVHFELQRQTGRGKIIPIDPQQYWLDGPGQVTCFDPLLNIPDNFPVLTYPVVCKDQ